MSYIIKDNNVVLNTKLTSIGRKLLAQGKLNFSFYTIGDSEINYKLIDETDFDGMNFQILRPKDNYPDVTSYLKQTLGSTNRYVELSTNNINVVELSVINTAEPRGFFTQQVQGGQTGFTLNSGTTYFKGKTTYNSQNINGTNQFIVNDASSAGVGDYLLVNWVNPNISAVTDITNTIISSATPFLWYKILNISSNTITVDRNIPNFNSTSGSTGYVYVFPSGNSINNYYASGLTQNEFWNPYTLEFQSNCTISENVPVLNCNIIYLKTQEGTDTSIYEGYGEYGSSAYYGLETYLSVLALNPKQKAIGVIHYSNNALTNLYGESFYESSISINLPTIMYHKTSDKIGVTLISDTTKKTEIKNGDITVLTTTYYDLKIKNPNTQFTDYVVGKIFNDLKIVVIEDSELLAAMSYKSNRNWTYPVLSKSSRSILNTEINTFSNTNEELYVTYVLENNLPYSSTTSLGLKTSLHCQEQLIFNSQDFFSNGTIPSIAVDYNNLKYYKDTTTLSNGEGYTATNLKLIMQKITKGDELQPDGWKIIDVTDKLPNYSTWSGSTIPFSSLNQYVGIDGNLYNSATTYELNTYLNIPENNEDDNLQFGDEVFCFGTFNADIAAKVYRTKYNFTLNDNLFNYSTNSSWSEGKDTYISEIAIYSAPYDNDGNKILDPSKSSLVAISKVSYPIKKNITKTVIIELDLDF